MTRSEALAVLSKAGLVGADAETALDVALGGREIDELLDVAVHFSDRGLMRWFGQDGGRAVVVLLRERRAALNEAGLVTDL